ncbi:MAG: hypothetical protein ABWX98_00350 [Lacisediminihabitans sp.]
MAKQRKQAARDKARRTQRSLAEQQIRSRESAPAKMPPWQPFWFGGAVVAVAGVAALIWLVLIALGGGDIDVFLGDFRRDIPRAAIPAGLLLIGGAFLFTGELLRRAVWEQREMKLLSGGTNAVRIPRMRVGLVVAWALIPLAVWIALIPVSVVVVHDDRRSHDDLWFLATLYGFLAAGILGVFLTSLIKRLAYRLFPDVGAVGGGELRFWRVASVQWRLESWFAFIGFGTAGILPLVVVPDGPVIPSLFWLPATVAGAFVAIAVGLALASPRSGFDYGVAESVV